MLTVADIKAGWQLGLSVRGVRVTIRRGTSPVVQDTNVRAYYGIASGALDLAGGVKIVSHEILAYADDLRNLPNGLQSGDKIVFEGRTATVEKADNTSGRVMGIPIYYRATVQQ